jgi:Uma2 family endonuclease
MQANDLRYQEKYTFRDYEKWDGDWELIYGNAFAMSPSPVFEHQYVSGEIFRQLHEQLEACPKCQVIYEMDWNISDETVVGPDIMVVCGHIGERVVKAPVIIFEVTSRQNAKRDEILKFELYRIEGVEFYGIVYPQFNKVKLYKLLDDKYKKINDFTNEIFALDIKDCKIKIDFSKIWLKK